MTGQEKRACFVDLLVEAEDREKYEIHGPDLRGVAFRRGADRL